MGDRWGIGALTPLSVRLVAVCVLMFAGCATVPEEEHQAALDQVALLEGELTELGARIAAQEDALAAAVAAAERAEAQAAQTQEELSVSLSELGALREERRALLEQLNGLQDMLADQEPERSPQTPEQALAGGGGFLPVEELGLRNDPRIARRFAAAAPGIAADRQSGVPRLFDSRLDYRRTAIFLTISDPAGNEPRLTLHTQYVTEESPLYLRSVFISIEGRDPVDPVDPIVLSDEPTDEPTRRSDGQRLLESITAEVTGPLADRLLTLVSSNRFTVTFVGNRTQYSYRPGVSERAALSNMLFAYFDLAGRGR
jgi:outer membrane murein-binding lipoprotein Lpp